MPTEPVVLTDVAERVAVVTLNRPAVRNAVSGELLTALRDAMARVDARDDVDAIVLTGAGPAFCAGLDLKAVGAGDPVLLAELGGDARGPWEPTVKPVIGAVNGPAVTGGLELALHCDLLLACERATFADTHTRVGVLPSWGLSVRLPDAVGRRTALRMSLTGAPIDADEARSAGLVVDVTDEAGLLPAARALGTAISLADQAATRALLASYRKIEQTVWGPGYAVEARSAADWRAGRADFSEVERRRRGIVEGGRAAHTQTRQAAGSA